MAIEGRLGIVGGAGALGGAIARRLLRTGAIAPERLWIAGRSDPAAAFAAWPGVVCTTDLSDVAAACDAVLLSTPPAQFRALKLRAPDRLLLSVMAGVTIERISEGTGAHRVVRAMSSPVAERGLAYSPWVASGAVTAADRAVTQTLFQACGLTDEVASEDQIDHFTALTGPAPGFVALVASAMIDHAVAQGVAPDIADRAVRQLFLASGAALSEEAASPAEQVQAMIDYAGTTAAGMRAMQEAGIAGAISAGLHAAAAKARAFGAEA